MSCFKTTLSKLGNAVGITNVANCVAHADGSQCVQGAGKILVAGLSFESDSAPRTLMGSSWSSDVAACRRADG
jgi:hypothetical protein